MKAFTMEIAGLVVRVQPLFESTREYCRPYLSDKTPQLFVEVSPENLAFEQKMLEQEAVEEGLKIRKFTEPFLERTAIQRRVADRLVEQDTLMLHGSTVAVDGCAYLFTAPCGTGKSTHTRLWREVFGDRAVMVNDDKPFLQLTPEGAVAYGSPWTGKHGLGSNVCVPLQGICFLSRGSENVIQPLAPQEAISALSRQMHTPQEGNLQKNAQALVEMLAQKVPLWEMSCNIQPEAARIAHAAMSGTRT